MTMKCNILILFTIYWFELAQCDGIKIVGAKCGVKTCQLSEYCSDFDRTCQSCQSICETSSHNYEEQICEKQCQNYILDSLYVKKGSANDGDLRATVVELSNIVTVNLTFVILLLIVVGGFLCFQVYRWKEKKQITLKSLKARIFNKQSIDNSPATKTNNLNSETKRTDLRIDMPSAMSNSENSPVTMTTSMSRRPAEDSALDYAYDNPAMTPGAK